MQTSSIAIPTQLHSTDDARFDADVASAPLVLVEFFGTFCPPCRAMQPTLQAVARERPDVLVLAIDVDQNQHAAQRFGIRAVPTFIAFRNGQPVGQLVGAHARAKLEAMLG